MHFPVQLTIGSARLDLHIVFEVLAFFVGFRYFLFLRKRKPDAIPTENRIWIIIGAAFGAFLFSRLVGGLEEPELFFQSGQSILYYYGSKTIVGGLLGGLLGVELVKKAIGERHSSGDLFTYPIILGIMIGRVGCFLAGVSEPTFGIESGLPWAMDLGDGILRHPTALYEILFLATLWIGLRRIESRYLLPSGMRFALFMVFYLLFRFGIDFLKPGFRYWDLLTSIQIVSLLGLLYYARIVGPLILRPSTVLQRRYA